MEAKRAAAEKAVEEVRDGMIVGLGTGSTAYWAIRKIGDRVREGLRIQAAATSLQSEELARSLDIPMIPLSEIDAIDLTIDGADEIDDAWRLIKGGGGALLREKIIASFSRRFIVVADAGKRVAHLGKFTLPVEIVPFGHEITQKQLRALGGTPRIRMQGNTPFLTDNGNYIADCDFGLLEQPEWLQEALHLIPGVVEHGLFLQFATQVVIGHADGSVEVFDVRDPHSVK